MKKTSIIVGIIVIFCVVISIVIFKIIFISKAEVKEIIMNHAEVINSDVKKWSIDFEYEDGMFIYDVDFIYNNLKYNYEINAKTGDIIIYKLDS